MLEGLRGGLLHTGAETFAKILPSHPSYEAGFIVLFLLSVYKVPFSNSLHHITMIDAAQNTPNTSNTSTSNTPNPRP